MEHCRKKIYKSLIKGMELLDACTSKDVFSSLSARKVFSCRKNTKNLYPFCMKNYVFWYRIKLRRKKGGGAFCQGSYKHVIVVKTFFLILLTIQIPKGTSRITMYPFLDFIL